MTGSHHGSFTAGEARGHTVRRLRTVMAAREFKLPKPVRAPKRRSCLG
jgi:hypothetical protein